MELKMTENNSKFINAFIKVAKMLEPNAEFKSFNMDKQIHEKGIDVHYIVRGEMITENGEKIHVVVSTEKNSLKGTQLFINYYLDKNFQCIESKMRSYWFHSFNWKGLMASVHLEEND